MALEPLPAVVSLSVGNPKEATGVSSPSQPGADSCLPARAVTGSNGRFLKLQSVQFWEVDGKTLILSVGLADPRIPQYLSACCSRLLSNASFCNTNT